jgi:hypothetical protein
MAQQSYKIAASFNNAAGLINLEDILIANRPYIVRGVGRYKQGEATTNTNGRLTFIGYPSVEWQFDVLTYAMYQYLKDTYCSGLYSGDVTIATRTDSSTYANYNAVMNLPFSASFQKVFKAYTGVTVLFTRLEAL